MKSFDDAHRELREAVREFGRVVFAAWRDDPVREAVRLAVAALVVFSVVVVVQTW